MELPRCICGDEVAVYHKECLALLTEKQRRALRAGRPVESSKLDALRFDS